MKTINEIMRELAFVFGHDYNVTLVPSVIVGTKDHICRAAIQAGRFGSTSTHRTSYRIALNGAFNSIDKQLADAAGEGPRL